MRCPRLVTLSALALTVAACSGKDKSPAALPPPEVPVVKVQAKDTPLDFELVAQIRGLEDVEIRARVEGYLQTIDYAEGSTVKKGALLFTIDDQQYVTAVAQAQAAYAAGQEALKTGDFTAYDRAQKALAEALGRAADAEARLTGGDVFGVDDPGALEALAGE